MSAYTLKGKLDNIITEVGLLDNAVISTYVSTMEAFQGTVPNDVSTISNVVENISTEISTISNTMALEATVSTLTNDVSTLTNVVESISTEISTQFSVLLSTIIA